MVICAFSAIRSTDVQAAAGTAALASVLTEPGSDRAEGGLDYAIRVQVGPTLLPRGPLLLDGVPLVIHALAPYRTLPGNAGALAAPELPVPTYRD